MGAELLLSGEHRSIRRSKYASEPGLSVATIPDNAVQRLHYLDPTDGQNKTCTDNCPLLTDPNVLYQDFLFDSDMDITGFQLTLSEWKGDGPGLHLLQLLSSGAFASAVSDQNTRSCFAPGPSNTTQTGTWSPQEADTGIPGTQQTVLVSTVDVGTRPAQGPSFTWMPYVSASGEYDVKLLVPGCTKFQDCALRTSVKVTVFPGGGLDPWVTTVSQRNTEDSEEVIYQGPVVPSTPDFVATVTMVLADQPEGDGQNGQYKLVADRVQLILTSANITSSNPSTGSNPTSSITERSFGFLEWPLDSSSTTSSSSSAIPTSAITSLDNAGFDFLDALGGASAVSAAASVAAVAQHSSGVVFLGGQFSLAAGGASGASNIVAYRNGALTKLPNNGLNGPVTSLVVYGDNLFVGGSFSDTAQSSNSALKGIAVYSISGNSWAALEGGVDGAVTSLDIADNQILVTGNFTELLTSGGANTAAGFAAWDVASSTWRNTGGFLVGSMTFVGNGTSSSPQFIAGNVASSLRFGASGFVMLSNGDNGEPQVTPLGVQFDSSQLSTTAAFKTRRAHSRRSASSWIPNLNVLGLFKRQTDPATLAPLPESAPAPAPAVLAGAFWTNSSTSREVVIIGGNFTYTAGGAQAQNVAIYDEETQSVTPLKGNQPNGTIRTLLVKGNNLYVGGEFTIQGIESSGFAIYDLALQRWDVTGVNSLQASSGSSVIVRSITESTRDDETVVVAGSFTQAGSTPCRAICSLNVNSKAWSALGNGIQGDVAAVVYAGVSLFSHLPSMSLTCDNSHSPTPSLQQAPLPSRTTRTPTLLPTLLRTTLGPPSAMATISLVRSLLSRSTTGMLAASSLRVGKCSGYNLQHSWLRVSISVLRMGPLPSCTTGMASHGPRSVSLKCNSST